MIDLLVKFILFGIPEVFILLAFYKNVFNLEKVKYWHGLLLIPFYFICGTVVIPFGKQISMVILMTLFLYCLYKDSVFKYLKFSIYALIFLVIIESIFCMIFSLLKIDLVNLDNYHKFLFFLIIRMAEILLIVLFKRRLKYGLGLVWSRD